ncbi:MAG: DUF2203 domain-containing protein [Planctomycetota bacterium]
MELNVTTEILSVEEARRRLGEVRVHVECIMEIALEADELQERESQAEGPQPKAAARLDELQAEFVRHTRAMNELGAVLKDAKTGLIDFYAWRKNEMVLLCWRHGEKTIEYWHGIDDGFGGRLAIDF